MLASAWGFGSSFGSCEHSPILSPVYRSFPSLRQRNGPELWPSYSLSPCLSEPPWRTGFVILFYISTAQQLLTAGPRANHIEKLVKYWQADGTHGPLENKATCLDLRISLKEFCPPGCCYLHYVPEEAGSSQESPYQGIQERYLFRLCRSKATLPKGECYILSRFCFIWPLILMAFNEWVY